MDRRFFEWDHGQVAVVFANLIEECRIICWTTVEHERGFQFVESFESCGNVAGDDGMVAPGREKIAQR